MKFDFKLGLILCHLFALDLNRGLLSDLFLEVIQYMFSYHFFRDDPITALAGIVEGRVRSQKLLNDASLTLRRLLAHDHSHVLMILVFVLPLLATFRLK